MTNLKKKTVSLIDDYYSDYSAEDVLDIFYPGSIGELMWDAYEAGIIPEYRMELFIGEFDNE